MTKLIESAMCIEAPSTIFSRTDGPVTVYCAVRLIPLGTSEGFATLSEANISGVRVPGWRIRFAGCDFWHAAEEV